MKTLFNTNENTFDNLKFDVLTEPEMGYLKGGFAPKEKDIWEPEDK